MTTNLEKLYDDYRQADLAVRLHMYLQFPELRSDFIEIDQEEPRIDSSGITNHSNNSRCRIGKFVCRSLTSFIAI